MRFLRTFASVAGALGFFTGCTALLGTFEVGSTGPDASDTDGSGSDGPVNAESGTDAPTDGPSVPLLTCSVDKGNIRLLDTARPRAGGGGGGGGQLSFDDPHVFHLANNKTRIVARPSQSQGFTVYEFDPKNGGSSIDTLESPRAVASTSAAHRRRRTRCSRSAGARTRAASRYTRLATRRSRSRGASAARPGERHRTEKSPQGTRRPRGSFAIVGTPAQPDYSGRSSRQADIGPFDLAIGRASTLVANPQKVVFTSNDATNPASPRQLLSAGSEIFMPLEGSERAPDEDRQHHPHPGQRPGCLAGGATLDGQGRRKAKHLLRRRARARHGRRVQHGSSRWTPPRPTRRSRYRLGPVKDTDLGTFVAEDIPVSFSFGSVTRLPADGGDARWLGDHFLATGKGQGVPGMILWYDVKNKALRANQTGRHAAQGPHGRPSTSITFAGLPMRSSPTSIPSGPRPRRSTAR